MFSLKTAILIAIGCTAAILSPISIPCVKESPVQEQASVEDLWTRDGQDWPDFLGAGRTGKSPETGLAELWRLNGLKVLWKCETGEGYTIGPVAAGRYFHFDRIGDSARLRCLNAETGEPIWEHQFACEYEDIYGYDGGPRAAPVVDGDHVYILGPGGMLKCVSICGDGDSIAAGDVIWEKNIATEYNVVQNFFGVGSVPLIHNEKLLVMVGGSPEDAGRQLDQVRPNESLVIALDKSTGDELYRTGDDLASYSSMTLAEIEGRTVALVWGRSKLIGFEPETGIEHFDFKWRSTILESVNAANPVVSDDQIFLSECYGPGSVLLNIADDEPTVEWSDANRREKAMAAHWNTPVLVDGFLYGCSGRHSREAELRCVEFATGKVMWSHPGLPRTSATWFDGHLAVQGENGELLLVKASPEAYEKIARYDGSDAEVKLADPCWSAPVISHGLMFVRGKDQVVCFEFAR